MNYNLKYLFSMIFWLVYMQPTYGQLADSLDQEVNPKYGIHQLAIKYYGINFTKEQRKIIEDIEIEFIFFIDEYGTPTLSEVNGIINDAILDSLVNKTSSIDKFNPRIRNGIPEPSIYFMKLTYPKYKINQPSEGLIQAKAYNEAKLEDFEYIRESGQRIDLNYGALANQFIGRPSKYLGFGGGIKLGIGYAGKNDLIFGMNMSFYGNKLKKEYPVNSIRKQLSAPPSILIGTIFGKWYGNFNLQAEFNLASQNITEALDKNDLEAIQLNGWSPGLTSNYLIKIGKTKTMYYYGEPNIFNNHLNIHFSLRYLKFPLKEATGLMVELGMSYSMSFKGVREYKLKDGIKL